MIDSFKYFFAFDVFIYVWIKATLSKKDKPTFQNRFITPYFQLSNNLLILYSVTIFLQITKQWYLFKMTRWFDINYNITVRIHYVEPIPTCVLIIECYKDSIFGWLHFITILSTSFILSLFTLLHQKFNYLHRIFSSDKV